MARKTKPGAASRAHYRIADKRQFPKFKEGMSVDQYAGAYAAVNRSSYPLTQDADFFQPLSKNAQFTQDDTVIEETCE